MNPAARSAWFVLAINVWITAFAQPAASNIPPEVQHFGPLVVVAFNEASADPLALRDDLLGGSKTERMHALEAMGIVSSPELHDLWAAFLQNHSGQSDDKGIPQFISGGMVDWNFGDPDAEPAVLNAGFDELTNQPLEFRGVFVPEKGLWRHVATVACRCQMTDDVEPLNMHAGHADPPQEWVISIHDRNDRAHEYRRTDIRFRLRQEHLWPLIQYEGMVETCPSGSFNNPLCAVTETNFEAARLGNNNGGSVSGFVWVSRSGHPPPCDKCGMLLRDPRCIAYVWNETSFEYILSALKPKTCGVAPQQSPAARQHSH
jgi:hypothetical protein